MFRRLARLFGSPERIRKDAGDLTLADWDRFPAWEFCLDEEGIPGQTECTVRPSRLKPPLIWPEFDGGVAASLRLANGRELPGVVWVSGVEFARANFEAEIWLGRPAAELCPVPLPSGWSQIICDTAHRLAFGIADRAYLSDEKAMGLIELVYKTLGVDAGKMWPMQITPRLQVAAWPRSWTVEGWRRAGAGDILK